MNKELRNLLQSLHLPVYAWNIAIVALAVFTGLLIYFILKVVFRRNAKIEDQSFFLAIIHYIGGPLVYFLPLFVLNIAMPIMRMNGVLRSQIDKVVEILLIVSFAVILMNAFKIVELYIYLRYDLKKADNLKERKVRTQLQFIKKIINAVIVFFTVAIILMSFPKMRSLGTGLITGAGIGGIIIGFAAQRSLSNFLAGMQIAFTQPIRIDDVLVVEGEWGRVEEITLTYVVLLIWDERRLILPINYFIEKPFQNWTRTGSHILGTVFLYTDYSIPVEPLRTELARLLHQNNLWDKRVGILQVTEAKEHTLELRALMSAQNASAAFDLRCFVRENMVRYIVANYPDALPKTRASLEPQQAEDVKVMA